MKSITNIRNALEPIGALTKFPPEPSFRGKDPGMFTTIWSGAWDEIPWNPNEVPDPNRIWITSTDETEIFDESDDDEFGGTAIPAFDPVFEIGADVDETFPVLNGTEGDRIRQSVLDHGMDALGWYLSFHVTGMQWGVFVPITGLVFMVREALAPLPVDLPTKIHLAFHAILHHELFHFATDYVIAQAELAHSEPWWQPAKLKFASSKPAYCVEEEALANANMLKAFRTMKPALRVGGKQKVLKDFTRKQPDGYKDGWRIRGCEWECRLNALVEAYGGLSGRGSKKPSLWGASSGYDWASQFPIKPRVDWRRCPIHIVNDGRRLGLPREWLHFFSRIENITETPSFRAKLMTMSPPNQRAWERTKQKIAVALTSGADCKKWPKEGANVFSIRVSDSVRAHLKNCGPPDGWVALAIGGHREMGHG